MRRKSDGRNVRAFPLDRAKRVYTSQYIVAFTGSSGHVLLCTLPSDFRRLRVLLVSTRFNGSRFRSTEPNAYILRNTLSGLRFCPFPRLMVREGGTLPHASPYGKGRCHEVTEGIRKSAFDKVNRNADINPQKGRHLLCSFCPCEKWKQGETSGNAARDKPAVSRTAARRR